MTDRARPAPIVRKAVAVIKLAKCREYCFRHRSRPAVVHSGLTVIITMTGRGVWAGGA
jgi:hypothetical protein